MTGKRPAAWAARVAAALLLVVLSAGPGANPASAAASFLSPVADRYEPGDEATLVGYVIPPPDGWEDSAPYTAFFRELGPLSSQVRIGPLDVEEVGTPDGPALRVSLVFRIPPDAVAGYYEVSYCDSTCTGGLGELVGSHPLSIGVDPTAPITREWPRQEPEIANLAADAIVSGPGFRSTAAEIRSNAPAAATATTIAVPTTSVTVAVTVPPTVALAAPAAPPPTSVRAENREPVVAPSASPSESNGWNVAFGVTLAVLCTAAVLVALRRGPVPARA